MVASQSLTMKCFSKGGDDPQQKQQKAISDQIETQIKEDRKEASSLQTLLLIGTGNAGKSTFAKQVCHILGQKQSHIDYKSDVRRNVLDSAKLIIRHSEKQSLALPDISADEVAEILAANELTGRVAKLIGTLYKTDAFKKLVDQAERELVFVSGVEAAHYFFQHITQFADDGYELTFDDILRIRCKTTGVIQYDLRIKSEEQHVVRNLPMRLIDVGGQQGERRKWLPFFADANQLIYLVATNEYDMVLEEDRTKNRLMDSLGLWFQLSGHPDLSQKPWVLFLNKADLFEKKIKSVPLQSLFSNWDSYVSNPEVKKLPILEQSFGFLEHYFRQKFQGRSVVVHRTSAIDTASATKVWESVVTDIKARAMTNFMGKIPL